MQGGLGRRWWAMVSLGLAGCGGAGVLAPGSTTSTAPGTSASSATTTTSSTATTATPRGAPTYRGRVRLGLPAGATGDALAVDPDHHRVFVLSGFTPKGASLTVLDGAATPPAVVGSPLSLDSGRGLAFDPSTSRLFVGQGDQVLVLDAAQAPRPLGPAPAGLTVLSLSVDTDAHLLFIKGRSGSNEIGVAVFDVSQATPKAMGSVRLADPVTDVAIDPGLHRGYVVTAPRRAGGAGSSARMLQVIEAAPQGRPALGAIAPTRGTGTGGGITVDSSTHLIYEHDDGTGTLNVFDGAPPTPAPVGSSLPLGASGGNDGAFMVVDHGLQRIYVNLPIQGLFSALDISGAQPSVVGELTVPDDRTAGDKRGGQLLEQVELDAGTHRIFVLTGDTSRSPASGVAVLDA